MHRSPLSVLVIFAALAACSKRDDSAGTDLLAQDRALVARLEVNQESRQLPLPTACGKLAIAAQPAVENKNKAEDLTRQAQDAEMHGNIAEARSLLGRASELDHTNKSAAYHLGRTSETLGDSTAALTAYCRYLALTPTTSESLEARQRVAQLSKSVTHLSSGSVSDSTTAIRGPSAPTAQRVAREQPVVRRRVAVSAPVQQAAPIASAGRMTESATAAPSVATESPTASEPVAAPRPAESTAEPTTVAGDVVATERPAPPVDQPSTAPRSTSRSSGRTQGAVIGAATGAIIGAATGRSVKSSVIGAAAGGLLGAVVGPSVRPMGRGIVPYARGT